MERTFNKQFWTIAWWFGFGLFVLMFFPYLFTQKSWVSFSFGDSAEIGATISGILGPFIAIIAAALTFLAFWVQYHANEQQ